MKKILILASIVLSTASFAHSGSQLFCSSGTIFNSEGKRMQTFEHQKDCIDSISGELFCKNGRVYNSKGHRLVRIDSQSECIDSIKLKK